MKAAGAWVFSARLHDADTATVVRVSGGEILTTDDVEPPRYLVRAFPTWLGVSPFATSAPKN